MLELFINYTKWHYTQAIISLFILAREFIRFFVNMFSIPLFIRSLFLPILNIPVNINTKEEIGDIFATFVAGIIVRALGAFVRLMLIILGIFFIILTIVSFSFIFILWLVVPLFFLGILITFIFLIFKYF